MRDFVLTFFEMSKSSTVGFQMVGLSLVFVWSGFRMVFDKMAAILSKKVKKTFKNRTFWPDSEWSTIQHPTFKMSGFRMVRFRIPIVFRSRDSENEKFYSCRPFYYIRTFSNAPHLNCSI